MFATLFLSATLLGGYASSGVGTFTVPPVTLQPLGDVDSGVVVRLAGALAGLFRDDGDGFSRGASAGLGLV